MLILVGTARLRRATLRSHPPKADYPSELRPVFYYFITHSGTMIVCAGCQD